MARVLHLYITALAVQQTPHDLTCCEGLDAEPRPPSVCLWRASTSAV